MLAYNTSMQTNWGLIGHQWAVQLLQNHCQNGTPRHAYLICGPKGIGKRSLALRFAQAVNSNTPGSFDPGTRENQQFEAMQHPDLALLELQEGDKQIKIEAVRELQRRLALSPYSARYRIALLKNFEEASIEAQNAILKTLEEPPPSVLLLVTAQTPESLLSTLVSRCELIQLKPMPFEQLAADLQQHYSLEQSLASEIAHLSAGKPGAAIRLAQHPEQLEQRLQWVLEFEHLLQANRVARFAYARKLTQDKLKAQIPDIVQSWHAYWRDIFICTSQAKTSLQNLGRAQQIDAFASQLNLAKTTEVLKTFEAAKHFMAANTNQQLILENLLINLPYL